MDYLITIWLEIHLKLNSNAKIFCKLHIDCEFVIYNKVVNISCNNIGCNPSNCNSSYAISCVNDVNCDSEQGKNMCLGLQCIDSIENSYIELNSCSLLKIKFIDVMSNILFDVS